MCGSFLGVLVESAWCILRYKKLESRKGVIFGPFNPLYGVAATIISFSICHVTNRRFGNIFAIGVVVASMVEYLASYYQEKVTGTVSWNYEKFKLNLNGRVNLVYSIFWGFLTFIWYKEFMPLIECFVNILEGHNFITVVAATAMFIDCVISLWACVRRKKRRQNIPPQTKFEECLDYMFDDELLKKVYPNSEFVE